MGQGTPEVAAERIRRDSVNETQALLNVDRLKTEMEQVGLDAVVAVSPENTFYLSGCFIRTQITIRDRLALVLWPREGEPTYIVGDIEEGLAQRESWIPDIQIYVEFAQSPINKLLEVIKARGLAGKRIGMEEHYLTASFYKELTQGAIAEFVPADAALERVRAVKTSGEISRITDAFLKTEEAIRVAWTSSRAGDTEKQVAERMIDEITMRGADGVRHISLNSGKNTAISHRRPDDSQLKIGEILGTDFGGNWGGFNSDIARVGIVGDPSPEVLSEYQQYREAYVKVLHFLKPRVTAADVYQFCKKTFAEAGMEFTAPHVGHSLSRGGGHENPILHPYNSQPLEANMLIALEPIHRASPDRKYHLEDLILITDQGCEILTPWQTHEEMIHIPV